MCSFLDELRQNRTPLVLVRTFAQNGQDITAVRQETKHMFEELDGKVVEASDRVDVVQFADGMKCYSCYVDTPRHPGVEELKLCLRASLPAKSTYSYA